MQVLYKELTTFEKLEEYLRETEIHVICSNVAISCAIHDQKLDESMNISGKTTTNIPAHDFCKSQDVGQYIQGNVNTFNQFQAISSMKQYIDKYHEMYHLLADDTSKECFFSLMMFFLCPYTNRFFQGKLMETLEKTLDFQGEGYEAIANARAKLYSESKELNVALGFSLMDFVEVPLLLREINKNQEFTFRVYVGEERSYFPLLTALPTEEESVPENTGKTLENPQLSSGDMEEFLEDLGVPTVSEKEEVKLSPPEPEVFPEEEEKLEEMLEDVLACLDLPKPQPAQIYVPSEMVSEEETEEETLRPMVQLDKECLERSLELLGTMEELVVYFRDSFPSQDPLYQELIEAMLTGVATIQKSLDPSKQEE